MLSTNGFDGPEHQDFLWENGPGAALLVHGFPGSPAEMLAVAEWFHERGWTVRGLLLPGFGPQIETLLERDVTEWQMAVSTALAELKRDYERVVLVGNSMGGALAIAAASADPPERLVLFAPFWRLDHILWQILPVVRLAFPSFPIFRLFKLDFDDPETRRGIRRFLPDADLDDPAVQREIRDYRLPIKVFNEIRSAGIAAHRAAPNVNVPTLIFQGRQDDLVQPTLTRQLANRLGGPAELIEIDAPHDITKISPASWTVITPALMDFLDIARTERS
jgi:carboxylesterase